MAKDFGELALVLGDAHVPGRAPKIPAKLKRMLVPNKMQHVLCTGNMGSRELYEELRALAPTQHFVCGDDDDDADFPEETITTCLLYTSPSPRDATLSRMPSSA